MGVAWNAYGCTGAAWLLYAVLFDPLYMLLGACPRRGDCCCGPWKASAEEGRECSIVIVLEDVMGSGSTSAMDPVVEEWRSERECSGNGWISNVGAWRSGSIYIIWTGQQSVMKSRDAVMRCRHAGA